MGDAFPYLIDSSFSLTFQPGESDEKLDIINWKQYLKYFINAFPSPNSPFYLFKIHLNPTKELLWTS